MTLVTLDGVSRRHAERVVLDDVSLTVADGERVGVIGRNGSGKSTLLGLLTGALEPDDGRRVPARHLRLAVVPQTETLRSDLPPVEAVLAHAPRADADIAGLPDRRARAEAVLERLGLGGTDRSCGQLSGGQRRRVALAAGLVVDDLALPGESVLLVLDEPTNHLDVDAVAWLQRHLLARRGALLLVTHDRYLLDAVATRIVEVEDRALHTGFGGYEDYLRNRAARVEQAAAVEQRRRDRARRELAWLRRSPAARTGKSRHRVRQATSVIEAAPPGPEAEPDFRLPSARLGSKVATLHHAGVELGGRTVLDDVTWQVGPDERAGVVGPNGAGKTTLLRLLAGDLEPTRGSARLGATAVVGFYGQQVASLPAGTRVVEAVDEVAREVQVDRGRLLRAGDLCERFGFDGVTQRSLVDDLSGGQRRRLELLRVLAGQPNLLLLDEPTNDLDLDTLAVLAEVLDTFTGAVVVATHDRWFLDRVCSTVWSVRPGGGVRHHPGGWSSWEADRRTAGDGDRPSSPPAPSARSTGEESRSRAGGVGRKLAYHERRELGQLESRLEGLARRRGELESRLQEVSGSGQEVGAVGAELADILARTEEAEARWLELSLMAEA